MRRLLIGMEFSIPENSRIFVTLLRLPKVNRGAWGLLVSGLHFFVKDFSCFTNITQALFFVFVIS